MVRLSFSMLINFPKLCYLDKWDHHGKIRKIWLPFQLCYSSGFPSSWVPISPVIAGVGTRASPSRTCFCLSPLHLIFYMCSPPFFCILLQYLIDSLWDLCAPFLLCKNVSAVQHRCSAAGVLGVRRQVLGSCPPSLSQCLNSPRAVCHPFFWAALSGFGVCT